MSAPPYSDLGKNARDVFEKGYHFGLLKLNVKTSTHSGVEFSSAVVSNQETGKVSGNLETKYEMKEGLTLSERWNTDNTLSAEFSIVDKISKGLKLSADCSFTPQTGSKSASVKTAFINNRFGLNCDMDFLETGSVISASGVFAYRGWLAGYQTGFDTQTSKITRNNIGLGFASEDFVLHTKVNDGQEFGASIYQKVSPRLDTGIQLSWSSGGSDTLFGIGTKYKLDEHIALRAKVDNASQVGLGFEQKLKEGVTLAMSVQIDGKNFNSGGHKFGAALNLEA